ncbi:hypothetical protein V6N13_096779 [Hibiscus sabdariffa]
MRNPSKNLVSGFPFMSGSHGSRPLEAVVVPVELTSLRHHGSLVPFEAQPVTKKGLCNIDDTKVIMEDGQQPNEYFDTLMGDIDENVLSANGGSVVGKMLNDSNQVIQDGNGAKQSFRDTLIRNNMMGMSDRN